MAAPVMFGQEHTALAKKSFLPGYQSKRGNEVEAEEENRKAGMLLGYKARSIPAGLKPPLPAGIPPPT